MLGVIINGHQSVYQIKAQAIDPRSLFQRGSQGLNLARAVKSTHVERATRLIRHLDLCSATNFPVDRGVEREASSQMIT